MQSSNPRDITLSDASASTGDSNPIKNRWAFLVGVNRYQERRSYGELNYCVNDVTALERLLEQVGYTVICLRDGEGVEPRDRSFPTLNNVKQRFAELSDCIGPNDLLLVAAGNAIASPPANAT